MGVNENLSNALGIEHSPATEVVPETKTEILPREDHLPIVVEEVESNPDHTLPVDAAEDYRLARDVLRKLIKKGSDAIDDVHRLADQQESSRGYEVLATMLKTVAETTKDLYDLQKKTKELSGYDTKKDRLDETNITVDKAVFVGTTADLLKQIKGKKEEE
jgi:hypothetical protein